MRESQVFDFSSHSFEQDSLLGLTLNDANHSGRFSWKFKDEIFTLKKLIY